MVEANVEPRGMRNAFFGHRREGSNVYILGMLVFAMAGLLSVILTGGAKSLAGMTTAASGDSEERLIPFLPGLTKANELAMKDNLYAMDLETTKKISYVPYHAARDLCKSAQFQTVKPGTDRVMNEISVGNAGSTWQLIMIGAIVRTRYRLPIVSIDKATASTWPGAKNVEYKEVPDMPWGEGENFGVLFKTQLYSPALYNESTLVFNAFKLSGKGAARNAGLNQFAKGACSCCFVMKELLGDKDAETAMIYMHAFALGLDLTEQELYQVRLKLAEWIKGHYCFPGSVHTSACVALEEFPELNDDELPLNQYADLEDNED